MEKHAVKYLALKNAVVNVEQTYLVTTLCFVFPYQYSASHLPLRWLCCLSSTPVVVKIIKQKIKIPCIGVY